MSFEERPVPIGESTPRVTIGVPSYNAAATIVETVESLLGQTYRDFELIVSDNASTDRTVEILADIATRDPRVRIVRQPRNIGANLNYSALVGLARGEYFKWSSSSDWCEPGFLARCIAVLDARPDAVLAYPSTRIYQTDRAAAENYLEDIDVSSDDPVERMRQVVATMGLNNVMNGLIRTRALRQTRLIEHFPWSDGVLIAHLALLGKLCLLPDRLFYRRMSESTATHLMNAEALHRHHYPQRTLRSLLPRWRLHRARFKAVMTAPLSAGQKIRAIRILLQMFRWDRRALARDLALAVAAPFGQSN